MKSTSFLDFVVIGAMKTGTTSLHSYLTQHPELCVPYTKKEINFFNNDVHWAAGLDWYEQNFERGDLKRGEVNPNYSMFPRCQTVPQRIHKFSPNAKLIYVVRDPIERMCSHIHHNWIKGFEDRSLDEIMGDKKDSLWYLAYSRYYYQLEKFIQYFDKDQMLITTLENISAAPESAMREIFTFLEVDSSFWSDGYKKRGHASAEKVKPGRLLTMFRKTPLLDGYQTLKSVIPLDMHLRVKQLLGEQIEKPQLSSSQIIELQDIFSEDIAQLECFLGRSFSNWHHKFSRKMPTDISS